MNTETEIKTETEYFSSWYSTEVDKGLVDIKFALGDGITRDTVREDFTSENNRVNRLIMAESVVNRPDVF